MRATTADWESIEQHYRAGALSLRAIGKRCGVTEGAIRKRAKRDGWARDITVRVGAAVRSSVRTQDQQPEQARTELVRTSVRTLNSDAVRTELVRTEVRTPAAGAAALHTERPVIEAVRTENRRRFPPRLPLKTSNPKPNPKGSVLDELNRDAVMDGIVQRQRARRATDRT